MANKRHKRLKDSRDALKLLGELVNMRLRGEIESDVCRDVGFLLKVFLIAYEKSELANRVGSLEDFVIPKMRV